MKISCVCHVRSMSSFSAAVLAMAVLANARIQECDQPPVGGERAESRWLERVATDLEAQEYHFTPVPRETGVFSAPSRAHGFRSRVSTAGLEVTPRATDRASESDWKLSLSTSRFGRVDHSREVRATDVRIAGDRIEIDHGPLTEWFVNDECGLEQGWTIARPPSGVGPVWIGLDVGGDLCFAIDEGGRSGIFFDGSGETQLRYTGLAVFDAGGRELDARILSSPIGVGITIDDTRAVYPLTVDPVLTGPAWTAESNQIGGAFGASVASAGDVNGDGYSDAIVGANAYDGGNVDEGRAFLYLGSSSGLASSAAWTADGNQDFAYFGVSVATAGDVNGDGYSDVIVGSSSYSNGEEFEGAAFVYHGSSTGLSATPAATLECNLSGASFGISVGTAGDVNGDGYSDVIVGATGYSNPLVYEGAAFLYYGSPTGIATVAAWSLEGDQAQAYLGNSVATAGDLNADGFDDVIVGAPLFDNTQADEGRALIYYGSAAGLTFGWPISGNFAGAFMGYSVAPAGDVNGDGYADVIVGAPNYSNGESNEGLAFVFPGSSSTGPVFPIWFGEGNQASSGYGTDVGTAGDVNGDGYCDVVVGAYQYDNGETDEGRAFVYLGSAAGLAFAPAWTAERDQILAQYGWSVAAAGDVDGDGFSDVIVGARLYDNGQSDEGRAFVYRGSSSGLATSAGWTVADFGQDSYAGTSVATAGDVNGDGYSDVIVGAVGVNFTGTLGDGVALLYLGSSTGLSASADWVAQGGTDAWFGYSVGTAGDVNGDGYSDVIVGALYDSNGETEEGRAFVYLGSASGLASTPSWSAESNQAHAQFGFSASTAGDVNGDGFGDVVVGAPSSTGAQVHNGKAYLYLGSSTGLSAAPDWTFVGDESSAWLGTSIATAGDVNADGYSDLIVGASGDNSGTFDGGAAYLFLGSSTGLGAVPSWSAAGTLFEGHFGRSVASTGDVNGDGKSDVIIGAPGPSGDFAETRVYVFLGSGTSSGLASSPVATLISDQPFFTTHFGWSVASAGDVNADGYSDILVGAPGYDTSGAFDAGKAFVYLGSASGVAGTPSWTVLGTLDGGTLGESVATAGDVNGDGFDDVVVGEPGFGAPSPYGGRVHVFLGNEGRGGWTRALQQRHADESAPIDLLGSSIDNEEFGIRVELPRSLAGFNWATGRAPKARLEWEVKKLSDALDGTGTERGMEVNVGGSLTVFDELARFHPMFGPLQLVGLGPYRWRARVRTNNPMFPLTRWVSIPWNNVTETKLTVPPVLPLTRAPH